MHQLRRLDLSSNPALGLAAAPPGAADPAAGECVRPASLLWLRTRLFEAAPLELLDLRGAGFGEAALVCLLRQMLPPAPAAAAAGAAPAAPQLIPAVGCLATLRCLKLGPPADEAFMGEGAVESLQRLFLAAPCLAAVELHGVTPAHAGALLAAWQQAQQARGHDGCAMPVAGGGGTHVLRLARPGQ